MTINLETYEIDTLLELLNRKIEKAEAKEIDEAQVKYVKDLKSIKASIEAQISNQNKYSSVARLIENIASVYVTYGLTL